MKKQIDNPPLSPACRLIGQFGNRWALVTLLTPREHGTPRFRELLAAVPGGISERMLASTLQELESLGLISRTAYPEIPPRVEYAVTSRTATLFPILRELIAWAEANAPRGE